MKNIKDEIKKVVEETTKFDFPLFTNKEKKKTIFDEKKAYIERCMRDISTDKFPDESVLRKLWNEATHYADEQFNSIREEKRWNGFYFQEVMHCYAEKIGTIMIH